jgi:cytochrome c556
MIGIARTRDRVFDENLFKQSRVSDMKFWQCAAILASLTALTGPALAQADVIAARQDGLKGVARQMEGIKAVVDQRGDPRATGAAIGDMIRFFEGFTARFPAGSGTGTTRALPAIWSDRAGFEAANGNMLTQLRALQAAANAGDQAAFGAAFQQTGATCGACHRPYRGPAR